MNPLFKFLSYINPIWYYNLNSNNGNLTYFPDYDKLSINEQMLLKWDDCYSSKDSSKLDIAYQAWCKGFIFSDNKVSLDKIKCLPNINDNYRFIKKYSHSYWSLYILFLRIFTFHNPLKELNGFFSAINVKRINHLDLIYDHDSSFANFNSNLVKSAPKVSIIIPTLNRYDYLKDALNDLEVQDYKNFDVIIVDQSNPFQNSFYSQFKLDIKVIEQKEKALWLARNKAIVLSDADYLLLYDDDSRTSSNWISQHLKCLDYFNADISSGVSISLVGSRVPFNYSYFRWSDQLDTGNVMIKRKVFREIGLFDRQFEKQRHGDGEFGLRAYLFGLKNISNPHAFRFHLKVGIGGLREMGSWDGFRPKKIFSPRPIPSVLYFSRRYFGDKAAILTILMNIPPSLIPFKYKRNRFIYFIGFVFLILLFPLLFFSVSKSWYISTKMINEGNKIDFL